MDRWTQRRFQPTSLKLCVDFDGSGTNNGTLADPEVVTYAYDPAHKSISMTALDARARP